MIAKVTHGLKDFAQPFVVADVVADEECVTHEGPSIGGIPVHTKDLMSGWTYRNSGKICRKLGGIGFHRWIPTATWASLREYRGVPDFNQTATP